MKLYGSKISYYTGKLEAYLRYKGLAYQRVSPYRNQKTIRKNVGAMQLPIVERADGRWMSDTTPILLQLESEHPRPSILPASPPLRFIALLMEDYADEWLWRPAMHYRWELHARSRIALEHHCRRVDGSRSPAPLPQAQGHSAAATPWLRDRRWCP